MTYADNRDLRQRLYMAYNTKCTHNNEFNNIEIVKKIANTRMKIAQLLGYKDYAEYTLVKRMAENSESVYKLLNQLLEHTHLPHNRNTKRYRSWHVKSKERILS